MKEIFDLNATNGDCIAKLQTSIRLRLICIEELGDDYTKTKNHASVWIPVNTKEFWSVIKAICDGIVETGTSGDNAKREFAEISSHVGKLIKQLEE